MSMQHCFNCDTDVDTDYDAEHFEEVDGKTECQESVELPEYTPWKESWEVVNDQFKLIHEAIFGPEAK